MSHLALALRRAAAKGLGRGKVDQFADDFVQYTIGLRPAVPVREPSVGGNPAGKASPSPSDRPGPSHVGVELHTYLPAGVTSQLANLVQAIEAHPAKPRSIAFVGSGRGEGTTTCVANMAAYHANRRSRVLMVDANLHHPSLHAIAGVERDAGLLELLSGEIDLRTAVKSPGPYGLSILTSGALPDDGATAVIVPSVFQDRLLSHTREFEFVLVDCPAVNAYEEAAMTAATCDAVVLVIEGGKTLREEAHASKAILMRAHCRVLGVVMNKRMFYVPTFLYDRL
jgi:capsular exopolysaccharide synthesis family protein